ncbi:PREDICTED: uncharacterized protein LOC108970070 isoform X2 [Bactrocera latifrons]|uniref:uncharacterized protein LOC108970070 isoform X2 n=1 Tax=Bactrocera latifrons TaxID=174628 RepID=UPI0008DE4497|nr:PREDICTED: uncharacterized protein LOC108970070 isoform X2 [Bactrocera latifrons]XP_018790741.1 PREDICTED: uncharacterized protein LOC108970070 isoform X2 [Bactrocera latifrons]
MNSNNNQASLNNKENLAPSLPIGTITNLTTLCNSQTGEAVNNQKKPLTNKKTINTSHKGGSSEKHKAANSVFKAPLPPKKLLYRKYLQESMRRENTEKALDLSRNIKTAPTRQSNPLHGLKTPHASSQKNKTPTDVTTSKIGKLTAPQQNRDIGAQTTTTHAQRAIVIVSPTHHSQKRAQAAQINAPSYIQSRNNVHEQQQKKLKVNEIDSEYMKLIRAHFDEFTVEKDGINFVTIGENGTVVWKEFLLQLNWNNTGVAITRKLLCHLFDHKTLATHTLTGKPSLVFLDRHQPEKRQLNQLIVEDIIEFMMLLKGMKARDVKTAINNKCVNVAKKFVRSFSAKAFAPPEANVTSKPETMFAVSSERNAISVSKVTSSDSYERNAITESEAASSDLCERNVTMELETVEVSSDSDSSEIIVV